jgi:hypothetical protein
MVGMSTIFPGMDPYLEDPRVWLGVHNTLIVYLADHLRSLVRPRYIPAVEVRTFVQGLEAREIIPDASLKRHRPEAKPASPAAVLDVDTPVVMQVPELEIHESYIEILDRESNQRIVTVIELLSPTNKFPSAGQESYLAKQREVRGSQTHLVEVDLLRIGQHVLAVPEWAARGSGPYSYLICVNRAEGRRDWFEWYPRQLRQRLPRIRVPRIRVPLADGDLDVVLDVQAVLNQTYEAGSYRERLRSDQPCAPPLTAEDQAWADEVIRAAQLNEEQQ